MVNYKKSMANGNTALISYTQAEWESKNLLKVMIGNFPPHAKASLKAICA